MADTTTTNLSLTKPELDVSTNWGQKLNANLDALDAIFSATGTGVSLNIDGGDIASAVTINKSPVITLGGDLTGSVTLTNLASGTLTATIAGTSVENSMLAGSIANSKLANSSITVSDGSNTTATALGGTITFSGTSNEVEVAESSGTITIGLPAATEITTSLGVGGGSTNGVQISQGAIAIKNGGTQSYIDFYCESSNAHYARLQAPAHANFGGNITLTLPATTGTLALTSGDITGNAATATALATARTIHGVSFDGTANIDLTEVIQDTVGAMVSGNTESNITVTYEDSDGTLDFSVTGGGSVSEAFKTISVSGQSDVVADAAADTLTLVAGSNMTITTNASGDEITFASSGGGGSQNLFSTISVSGQSDVVADATTDTLTLVAGSNITLTTDASNDSITIASSASGSGGSSTQFAKNTFTGDDSTVDFTLTQSMTSEDGLIVFIDGVYQADNVYSVSGTTLTFATAPLASRVIEVFQLEGGIVGSAPVVDTMTGDNSDTTLTLSVSPISENQTFVTFDGVVQHKSTYSVSGNTLTFSTAPATGVAVECVTFNNVAIATFEDADGDTKIQVEESSDEDIIRADVGGTELLTLSKEGVNADATLTLKGTNPTLIIGDGGAEDTKIVFDGNAQDFHIGLDDTYDDLVIGKGNSLGTTPAISINENEDVCINGFSYALAGGAANYGNLTINGTEGGILEFADDGVLSSFIAALDGSFQMLHQLAEPMLIGTNNTEAMRITSDNKIGIGTSSPETKVEISGSADNGLFQALQITNTDHASGETGQKVAINFKLSRAGTMRDAARITAGKDGDWNDASGTDSFIAFDTTNNDSRTEKARINSTGNLLLGDGALEAITYTSANKLIMHHGHAFGNIGIYMSCGAYTSNYEMLRFYNGNGVVGNIAVNGSTLSLNQGSDYRLKENVTYDWDATTRLKQLKPARFNWIADETNTLVDGFLAHEVSDAVPNAVSGEKDAVYTAQDEANNLGKEGEPNMQSIDHSKLVPLLVKTIQELEARITTLEGS